MKTLINTSTNTIWFTGGDDTVYLGPGMTVNWNTTNAVGVHTPLMDADSLTADVISYREEMGSPYIGLAQNLNVSQVGATAFMAGLPYGIALAAGLALFLGVRKAWSIGDAWGD